jgi:hypothetical protein
MSLQSQITQNRQAIQNIIAQAKTISDLSFITDIDNSTVFHANNDKKILATDLLKTKANINGNINESFNVLDGVLPDEAVNVRQLEASTLLEGIDPNSFYIDTKTLFANISIYRQTINYTSGSQTFDLDFFPTFFIGIFVNGVYLDETDYIFTPTISPGVPNTLEILGTLESGDLIRVVYQKFVQTPTS